MHRLSNGTQSDVAPAPPAVVGTPGYPTQGDPTTGNIASELDYYWDYALAEEVCHVIEAAGIVLDKTNNGQLLQALAATFQAKLGFIPVKQGSSNDGETHAVTLAWNPEQPNAGDARLQLLIDNVVSGNVVTDLKGTVTASGAYVEIPLFGSVKMLVQVGQSSTGPTGTQTINFPEPFVGAVIGSFACANGIPSPGSPLTVQVGQATTTPLQTMAVVSSNGGAVPFSWLAIGIYTPPAA